MELSDQQKVIVNAPFSSLSVIACAGSGKTKTAVYRLAKIRRELDQERGYIALLSFSNIAVDTFNREFSDHHKKTEAEHCYFDRVTIDTIDGFISSNILRPHSFRSMKCAVTPFLISGREAFLENKNYKFWVSPKRGKNFPILPKDIHNITFRLVGNYFQAFYSNNGNLLPVNNWRPVLQELAKLGAYTHEFGKYWAVKSLVDSEGLLNALVKRYPHIIVDEAQDIDTFHGVLLDLLARAGSKVSLIGDPNQAIYEFAGADGSYLKAFSSNAGCLNFSLLKNRRSVQKIVELSGKISSNSHTHARKERDARFGAYYCVYGKGDEMGIVDAFVNKLDLLDLDLKQSAVLVRSRELKSELRGATVCSGRGKTQLLVLASIKRDIEKDVFGSFKLTISCISALIQDAPKDFQTKVMNAMNGDKYYLVRQLIWKFVRNVDGGLPSVKLNAKSEWHPKVKTNLSVLLGEVCSLCGFSMAERLGNQISASKLENAPIFSPSLLDENSAINSVRVDTVHQAKGESLDAVLYIANNNQASKLIKGTDTELGRIGYVAITRARDLFLLAIPEDSEKKLGPDLKKLGFAKW